MRFNALPECITILRHARDRGLFDKEDFLMNEAEKLIKEFDRWTGDTPLSMDDSISEDMEKGGG